MSIANILSRRKFVTGLAAMGVLSAKCTIAFAQAATRTRRSITKMASNDPDLLAYRKAVAAMKALDQSKPNDPRGWTKQASIHNNSCPHGNWFFLPWHRSYLYWFEQICAELSGRADFALPYWDWTAFPAIPPHLKGAANPLFHPRNSNPALSPGTIGQANILTILKQKKFENFGSGSATILRPTTRDTRGIENPHNHVHGQLGCSATACNFDMGSYMSPLDPIFWLHHCNIDRHWAAWQELWPNSLPLNNASWADLPMPMFFDKAGQPIPQTKRPVKAYKNISDFAYKYDQLLKPPANQIVSLANFSTNLRVQSLSAAPAALGNFSTVGGRIAADFNSINGVANRNMALPSFAITNSTAEAMVTAAPEPNGSSAQVTVEGLEMPANPGASVDVYINAFEDEKDVTNSALHLAGRIWFFGGHEHMATMGGASYTIDISDALARLKFASRLRTGKIQPQLVTTLPDGRRGPPPKVNGAIKVEISS